MEVKSSINVSASQAVFPLFRFERILATLTSANAIPIIVGVYLILGVVPDLVSSLLLMGQTGFDWQFAYITLRFHFSWTLVLIASLYFAVRYKKMYFGVVAKYGLSSFTISKITRSFGNRKLFFLFLSTFEVYFVWLAVYLYLTSDYFLNDISNYLWAFVMIFVLVPIWAEIFAAAWSGMLSVKAISEELLVDLSNNKDPLGLNPFSTLWTKLALVNLPLLLFASALYIWAFISVILLMLLWAVSFGFVQISVHGYLSRLKSKLLGELSYSHTRWSEDSRKDGPVHVEAAEASDSFSLAFNSRFEQSLTGVRRMRIWLFSAKTTFGFVAYGIVLLVVALLSWYGLENISFGGGA